MKNIILFSTLFTLFSIIDSTCVTKNGKNCVFPFKYNGVTYTTCTTVDFGSTQWCATSVDSSGEYTNYGECSASGCASEVTVSKEGCPTENGKRCIFPFVYKGVRYSTCTTVDFNGVPWCATSVSSSDVTKSYGLCSSSCPVEATVGSEACGTIDDRPCVFPFTYSGTVYSDCTTVDNSGTPWCATAVDSSTNEVTTFNSCNKFCVVNDSPTTTTPTTTSTTPSPDANVPTTTTSTTSTSTLQGCTTSDNKACIFPFKYNDVTYSACTTIDNGNTHWCATSVNSAKVVVSYGDCSSSCPTAATVTTAGCPTTNNRRCIFPFVYKGVTYESCTVVDFNSQFWCATSVNSQNIVKDYGLCSSSCPKEATPASSVCATDGGRACVFPFKYKDVTYTSCTTVDFGTTKWCATSVDGSQNILTYGNCGPSC